MLRARLHVFDIERNNIEKRALGQKKFSFAVNLFEIQLETELVGCDFCSQKKYKTNMIQVIVKKQGHLKI